MPTSYINLCNKVLRRLNEVEIEQADFSSVRGVQALVKDSVKAAIAKINQAEYEWPFNETIGSQVLVPGQTEYTFPAFYKVADWSSFQIQKNETLNTDFKTLRFIERDEWLEQHRDSDYNAGSSGRGVPDKVFPGVSGGFGVTPSPSSAFTVRFNYFLNYADLTISSDQPRIPSEYDNVIVDGAMYYMYMFKDNMESAQITYQAFAQGLKEMQSILINDYQSVRDTRVSFGGGLNRR